MIINGKEWRMVPVEATEEMNAAATDADKEYTRRVYGEGHPRMQLAGEDHYAAMLAAAPAPPVADVTIDVLNAISEHYHGIEFGGDLGARLGRDMIAAVQSTLGTTLGMVTREEMAREVEAALREGHYANGNRDLYDADYCWEHSEARKRLEGGR